MPCRQLGIQTWRSRKRLELESDNFVTGKEVIVRVDQNGTREFKNAASVVRLFVVKSCSGKI